MLFVTQHVSALERRIEKLERQLVKTPLPIAQPVPKGPTYPVIPFDSFPFTRMTKNPIKNCPAKKGSKIDDPMLPCEFYGIEVDVSQQGIWFDGRAADGQEEELISVLRKIDKPAAANIKKLFKSPTWADQLKKKIEIARAKAEAYAAAVSQLEAAEKERAAAEEKSNRAPDNAAARQDYQVASQEFERLAAIERSLSVEAKFNITPGFEEENMPPEFADDPNELPKGCPAKPGERMIKMAIQSGSNDKENLILDVSTTGIWFDGGDEPELVRLLEDFKTNNNSTLKTLKDKFLNSGADSKALLNAKFDTWKALILARKKVYDARATHIRQAKFHRKDSAIYSHFMQQAEVDYQEFTRLSVELKKPVKL